MKTGVEVKSNVKDNATGEVVLEKGSVGYVDGYLQTHDRRGYAVVVVGEGLFLCPLSNLRVIQKP